MKTPRPSESLLIRINGIPQGKGRPRFTKSGRAYTPAKTRRYEAAVQEAALAAAAIQGFVKHDGDTPLEACITAWFPIPASWPKKKREAAAAGGIYPTAKPDADNLCKAILDALNGIAYRDDKQIVSCHVCKRYTCRDDDTPRVVVHIAPMKTLAQLRKAAFSDGLREGRDGN
ncbi:Holliday junction resolvase [Kingella potus]|uniref:Holliday junction resolvase n=1 Tax=Kingella potus TaxID=265175 RepID=A0A377R4L1_9NEIS|nr:RusA family crossover junction endodeoxyribonuclease [Kingella potus]UOP02000.1 RusA family crossover junction endodeoxyribonuclease [Kingella potus]STR03421.1 Holliday junction resolvase [Kingella potus]